MFPTGWPGIALLLLRFALGATLSPFSLRFPGAPEWTSDATLLVGPVILALLVGILTPIAAVLCIVIELAAWHLSGAPIAAVHLCAMLVAASLAMLGPGAYSLDARLFGRRQLVFPSREGEEKS
jgi:hypothetical protein